MTSMLKVALLLLSGTLIAPVMLRAQTLTGFPGLVKLPTADFMRDGTFYLGAGFIPKEDLRYANFQRDGLVVFASLTFLPYLEVDVRFTKQLGRPASEGHTVDRSPSVRFKLLRERRYLPAAVIGIHDVFSTVKDGQARHFGATYLVLTKRFVNYYLLLAPSVGYGFNFFDGRQSEPQAFFGGFKIQSRYLRQVTLAVDYDAKKFNLGVDVFLLKMLQMKIAMLDMQYFAGSASMHFDLFDVF